MPWPRSLGSASASRASGSRTSGPRGYRALRTARRGRTLCAARPRPRWSAGSSRCSASAGPAPRSPPNSASPPPPADTRRADAEPVHCFTVAQPVRHRPIQGSEFVSDALRLSHTGRSEEQVRLQQFSTPLALAYAALQAAAIRPGDVVLESSAGIGMLAVMAACALGDRAAGALHLNEYAHTRVRLLYRLFPRGGRDRLQRRGQGTSSAGCRWHWPKRRKPGRTKTSIRSNGFVGARLRSTASSRSCAPRSHWPS